ncbi:MAG: phytanoyl-CoA dioxygenase family protein [Hormoscilla sp. SP12CHS1]|nr:phytanoyl-CoA dioxygenase family protein [Hormoscilla sp. SP12CHS1]
MEVILKKLELVYCEMQPGDILIMHGNKLHYSENNQTDHARILVVSHYNSADNEPYDLEGAEILRYRPLNKLPDSWLQDKNMIQYS